MIRINTFFVFLFVSLFAFAGTPKTPVEEYIDKWKDVAIHQMKTHKIPASIIMAQAILESGSGSSLLAQKANNHFGIKCHDWKGKTFYQDDDKKDECFRKYKNASESFEDHSKFLTGRSRYAFLFALETNDYKGWAEGLKKAGYATNPAYAQRLISLIERYQLNQFDEMTEDLIATNEKDDEKDDQNNVLSNEKTQVEGKLAFEYQSHEVKRAENQEKFVVAKKHDTMYLISKEFGLNLRQLNKWNEFPAQQDVLKEGDKIYISPRSKNIFGKNSNS